MDSKELSSGLTSFFEKKKEAIFGKKILDLACGVLY